MKLTLSGFSRCVVPRISMKDVVLSDDTWLLMNEIILNHKSNALLNGQWGSLHKFRGTCILISGPSGVAIGKSFSRSNCI